ncbi:hypothetical protein GQX74_003328 [Glossina fuscipes]|nr:hypothetical protein GQX74_003328 [Glossina fuscipes]
MPSKSSCRKSFSQIDNNVMATWNNNGSPSKRNTSNTWNTKHKGKRAVNKAINITLVINILYISFISVLDSILANFCQIFSRNASGTPNRTKLARFFGLFSPSHSLSIGSHSSSVSCEQSLDTSPVPLSNGSSPSDNSSLSLGHSSSIEAIDEERTMRDKLFIPIFNKYDEEEEPVCCGCSMISSEGSIELTFQLKSSVKPNVMGRFGIKWSLMRNSPADCIVTGVSITNRTGSCIPRITMSTATRGCKTVDGVCLTVMYTSLSVLARSLKQLRSRGTGEKEFFAIFSRISNETMNS